MNDWQNEYGDMSNNLVNGDDDDRENDSDMDIENPHMKGQDDENNAEELTADQKLGLAERANEIYRQQLKYMQDHLSSLRSLIQDKENIIENLMLRYDLGIINADPNKTSSTDPQQMEELRRKAEALAQRTILENFELREMVNELRDENFHLRNEIYELQDKINRQVLLINKLEKNQAQPQENRFPNGIGDGVMEETGDGYIEDDDNEIYEDQNEKGVIGADGRRMSKTLDHPANSQEAREVRLQRQEHARAESGVTPNIFGNENSDSGSDKEKYMTEEAKKKREERAHKGEHKRGDTIPTPDIFEDNKDNSEEARAKHEARQKHQRKESEVTPDLFGNEDLQKARNSEDEDRDGKGRRGSQQLDLSQENTEDKHRRNSSIGPPPLFSDNYEPEKYGEIQRQKNSAEAQQKREERAKRKQERETEGNRHTRKESQLYQQLFASQEEKEDQDDPEIRKQRAAERRNSRRIIRENAGDKGHFTDPEDQDERPTKKKTKSKQQSKKTVEKKPGHVSRSSVSGAAVMNSDEKPSSSHHRRESSVPIPNLGFEDDDPATLNLERLKVKDLEKQLAMKIDAFDLQAMRIKDIEQELLVLRTQKNERQSLEREFQKRMEAQMHEFEAKAEALTSNLEQVTGDLTQTVRTKNDLVMKCSDEINRLTAIVNTMLQLPKFAATVQMLIDDSNKNRNAMLKNSQI